MLGERLDHGIHLGRQQHEVPGCDRLAEVVHDIFADAEVVAGIQEMTGAVGFDAPGARYPHRDKSDRCSFEALVATYRPRDAALAATARIVHGADFADEVTCTPESAGLRAISRGFPLVAHDDNDTLDRAAFLYDALYAALREQR